MARFEPTRRDDLRDLQILHMLEVERAGGTAVAARFGMTRSAVQGLAYRMNTAATREPCACVRPENRDGGMPARWWAKAGAP